MDNIKERALRLAKELHPEASTEALIISATKIEGYLVTKDSMDSFNMFARKCTVMHPVKGYISFDPRPYQKEVMDILPNGNRIIINTSRQNGTTYMLGCYALWEALTKPFHNVVVVSNKFVTATEMGERALVSYDQFVGYKPGLTRRTKSSLEFSNGSRIIFAALTENTLRGHTVDTIIMDNAAYISHSIMHSVWPLIMTGTKIIMASTPNTAEGPFYDIWTETNDWIKIALPWHLDATRDQAWMQHMKTVMSAEQFSKEFECKFATPIKP